MKRENRKPARAEWERITSSRPVVHRIPNPEQDEEKLERIAGQELDMRLEDEESFRRWQVDV